jgi:hypothetical protein
MICILKIMDFTFIFFFFFIRNLGLFCLTMKCFRLPINSTTTRAPIIEDGWAVLQELGNGGSNPGKKNISVSGSRFLV